GKRIAETGSLAAEMTLEQNKPNPFTTTTTIAYTLGSSGNARISLYSADGRKLGVIVDADHAAGSYSTLFDASFLAPGNYYYVLESLGSVKVQNMTVVR
ncbi:MAG: T9SS type A sorting domain-containing protein, partial [bacterium]|nr:T9SS type A sorting domain-containing protein [Candidatus Kapabacteria bacterium]